MNAPMNSHRLEAAVANAKSLSSIAACFAESPYPALRAIQVALKEGNVHLEGEVPSYHMKQLAQEIALQHEAVDQVNNNIRVE